MIRRKPTWYWLAPILIVIGHWERWLYAKTYGHSPIAHAEFQYVDERVMPYYWATTILAALVLIVFGRSVEAILAWLLSIALFFFGWFLIYPSFLA